MARQKLYTEQITVCLKSDEFNALGKMSEDTDVPKSRLIRQAIVRFLRQFPEYYKE
jgi:hypothetical protein